MHRDRAIDRFASALLAVWLLAVSASAQGPVAPEIIRADGTGTPGGIDQIQRLEPPVPPKPVGTIPDSPGGAKVPTGIAATPPRGAPPVSDPPTPSVQLQIRTPAHAPPGKPIAYKIAVTNRSGATAYRVLVRVPMPEGAAGKPAKCEPPADLPADPKQLTWSFKTLPKGEQKTIDLEFLPDPAAKEVRLRAHVSFEHGEEVITTVDKPKLTVKKAATPQVSLGELVTVRVEVTNAGTVPIPQARLVETVPAGAEFRNDKDSEKGADAKANQRSWDLGTLEPGQSKIVTYQLVGKAGGELVSTSMAASADKHAAVQSESVESKTKILVPAIKLDLSGPPTVGPKEAALYTARVQNTGTQPLENVRVAVNHPEDCEVTKVTAGARRAKDQVVWTLPKLAPGEAFDFRLSLESNASGKKVVKATAREGRAAVEDAKQVTSDFQGRADLTWKPEFDDVTVNVGKQGIITVKVRNQGTETERAMTLRVELPANVKFVQGTPNQFDVAGTTVVFKPRPIAPDKTESFSITYEAKQAGPAPFRLLLEAETLGKQPLTKEQVVQVNNAK